MSDYISTYTGIHMIPTKPHPQDISIDDIAHVLSLLCRGNGHVNTFFSVGQHCIFCAKEAQARGYSARICLACLLHDAGEAYLSDITRPFKKHLKEYARFEEQILSVIYTKFLGSLPTPQEAAVIRQIDDEMLYFDLEKLLNEPQEEPAPKLKTKISYEVVLFERVEEEYKRLFYTYQEGMKKIERL